MRVLYPFIFFSLMIFLSLASCCRFCYVLFVLEISVLLLLLLLLLFFFLFVVCICAQPFIVEILVYCRRLTVVKFVKCSLIDVSYTPMGVSEIKS